MKHIKRLQHLNNTWVLELWNGQVISDKNLARAIEILNENVWPQPELSVTIDLSQTNLYKGAA